MVGEGCSQAVEVIIGGIITLVVAHLYYKKAATDLRWEARAGAIHQSTLELLVAYVEWGKNLRTDQAFSIGGGNNQPHSGILRFDKVLSLLKEVGLADAGRVGFGRPIGPAESGPPLEDYSTLFITNEGKELAKYIKNARRIDQRVVELFKLARDEQSQTPLECLWTIVPGRRPGPIDEYWKHVE